MRLGTLTICTIGMIGLAACTPGGGAGGTDPDPAATKEVSDKADGLPCPFGETKDWRAWLDTMPGSPPTLYITGQTEVGSDGYGPVLTVTSLEEMVPANVRVDLTLAESSDGTAGWQEARLEEDMGRIELNRVKISCHGESIFQGKIEPVS